MASWGYSFSNGTAQQRAWFTEAIEAATFPWDELPLSGTIEFVSTDPGGRPGDYAYTTITGDTFVTQIRDDMDTNDAYWRSAVPFNQLPPNDPGNVERFFKETVVHELFHVALGGLDAAAYARFCGYLLPVASYPADWNPDGPWDAKALESVVEIAKDLFLPKPPRLYDNRTARKLNRDHLDDFSAEFQYTQSGAPDDPDKPPGQRACVAFWVGASYETPYHTATLARTGTHGPLPGDDPGMLYAEFQGSYEIAVHPPPDGPSLPRPGGQPQVNFTDIGPDAGYGLTPIGGTTENGWFEADGVTPAGGFGVGIQGSSAVRKYHFLVAINDAPLTGPEEDVGYVVERVGIFYVSCPSPVYPAWPYSGTGKALAKSTFAPGLAPGPRVRLRLSQLELLTARNFVPPRSSRGETLELTATALQGVAEARSELAARQAGGYPRARVRIGTVRYSHRRPMSG